MLNVETHNVVLYRYCPLNIFVSNENAFCFYIFIQKLFHYSATSINVLLSLYTFAQKI